jgi:predicted dehydrogenase
MAIKKLRVGVVGVGHIGSNHTRLYAEIPSTEFTAVYDVDVARGNAIAKKFGATSAPSLDEFIGMVDAASVATPTNTHYEIARSLLGCGKHVLVEKPITDNTAHATELAELAAHKGLILQVGHVERFNPVLSVLEKHLTHPRFIEAHRLSPYPDRSTDIGVVLCLVGP